MGITPFAVLAVIVLLASTYAVLAVPGTVQLATPKHDDDLEQGAPLTATT
ncbi:hypothetical protein ACWC9Q_37120 [Streptomyces sp. NPDC001142]